VREAGVGASSKGSLLALCATLAGLLFATPGAELRAQEKPSRCPADMVLVRGFCVDRWEASMVDRQTGKPLSPYYPPSTRELVGVFDYWVLERKSFGDAAAREFPLPELPEWQREHDFSPRAVSRPGVVPQAYVSYPVAKRACEACGQAPVQRARVGARRAAASAGRKFPYGDKYQSLVCNVHRAYHPAFVPSLAIARSVTATRA
jgi:hypothetical protein